MNKIYKPKSKGNEKVENYKKLFDSLENIIIENAQNKFEYYAQAVEANPKDESAIESLETVEDFLNKSTANLEIAFMYAEKLQKL